ncbi:MAG: sulfate respiration complex protein HmcD [Desulfovibrionaceae bacterium]
MHFYTLQDFLTHTKGLIYVLMGGALVCFVLWWRFLTGRDPENHKNVK